MAQLSGGYVLDMECDSQVVPTVERNFPLGSNDWVEG